MRLSFPDQASKPGDPLPSYSAPPVIESSIGIQFDGLSNYHSLDAWDFWAAIKQDFPNVEEQAPLDPVFETFGRGDAALRQASPQLQFVPAPVQPRFMFVSAEGSELVQLQHDRLFFNWRKRSNEAYPRYPFVRDKLESLLRLLYEWAKRNNLGEITPTQSETLYVNRFPIRDDEGNETGLSEYFPWLAGLMGKTEDGTFVFRRRLNDENGAPAARLLFDLRYGTDQMNKRDAQLILLVRGRPLEPSIEGCLDLIDAEREIIVRTFTELTAPKAHRIWGREP